VRITVRVKAGQSQAGLYDGAYTSEEVRRRFFEKTCLRFGETTHAIQGITVEPLENITPM
jgi:hypothetical protein